LDDISSKDKTPVDSGTELSSQLNNTQISSDEDALEPIPERDNDETSSSKNEDTSSTTGIAASSTRATSIQTHSNQSKSSRCEAPFERSCPPQNPIAASGLNLETQLFIPNAQLYDANTPDQIAHTLANFPFAIPNPMPQLPGPWPHLSAEAQWFVYGYHYYVALDRATKTAIVDATTNPASASYVPRAASDLEFVRETERILEERRTKKYFPERLEDYIEKPLEEILGKNKEEWFLARSERGVEKGKGKGKQKVKQQVQSRDSRPASKDGGKESEGSG
jgi:hypothetical protein